MGRQRYGRMDKLVYHDNVEVLTNAKAKILTTRKIDADSVPAAYVKSYKISITDNNAPSDNVNYAFYACLDESAVFDKDRIIDHWVSGVGGGTGYLNINRKIWHSQDEKVGGPITIWAECSGVGDTVSISITTFAQRAKSQKS